MSDPIRVLQVFAQMNRGGAETMIMNLYRNIDRSRVQFDFIVHTEGECDYDEEIEALGGVIYRMPRYSGKNHLRYKKSWNEFFREHTEYRIIHGHVRSTAAIYLKIAKAHRLTTIAHSHSTSSGRGVSAIIKNILQYPIRYTADYLFACSKTAGEWLFGKKIYKNEKFLVVNNAIDSKKFIFDEKTREEIREEFAIDGKFVIGHIGRFNTPKNHEFLIDIFKEVYEKNNRAVLLLVGDGELREPIKAKINKMNLSDNVIFTGVRKDIPEILQAMDIFVFPSLYEGLGIAVIEAQAAGLPCIVAETIPKEAFVTDHIYSLSLKQSANKWANQILEYSNGFQRKNAFKQISNQGYDIFTTAKFLEDFYLEL
ncbi:glycosyltransferase family 1 protein [Sutcliffiella cohnii]